MRRHRAVEADGIEIGRSDGLGAYRDKPYRI
jgi:hypothetical protein